MEEQKDINLKYEAPVEIFQEIFEDYQKKNKKNMKFDSSALTTIYNELQRKGIYLTSFIQQGSFGCVFEALYQEEIVAIKCIGEVDFEKIQEEEKILQLLKETPYVMKSIKEFLNKEKTRYYQVSKRYSCSLKEIMKFFFDQKKTIPLNQIIGFAIQISTVFEQMQQKNLMHSDIKPDNILYDSQEKSFHICDFGESKQFKKGTRTYKLKGCTKNYAAPEYLDEDGSYNIKFDIFSLGIILLELTRGQFLESKDCTFIRDGGLQNYMSKNSLYNDLNNIIGQMLQTKSENRINSFELTNQLNKLRTQLENQFISLVQDKMDFSESRQMISKFKQSFLKFNYSCKQNEVRIDKYSFKDYSNLSKINDCIAKRLIHHLDLNFRNNNLSADEAKNIGTSLVKCLNIKSQNLNLSQKNGQRENQLTINKAIKNKNLYKILQHKNLPQLNQYLIIFTNQENNIQDKQIDYFLQEIKYQ
ncbi:hypothetical protein ABPG74_019937 [Tetrahymena malaccensis]